MDVESDDSERWEDFFGSSTDLTPSLIGLYDSLNVSFNTNDEIVAKDEKEPTETGVEAVGVEEEEGPVSSQLATNAVHQSITSKNRGLRVLLPDVQRLISYSGVLRGQIERGNLQCNNFPRNNSFSNNSPTGKRVQGKQKHAHIPLLQNTCKLTQSGNELVNTFEGSIQSSNESLNQILNISSEIKSQKISNIKNETTQQNSFNDSFLFDKNYNLDQHRTDTIKGNQISKDYFRKHLNSKRAILPAHQTADEAISLPTSCLTKRVTDMLKKLHSEESTQNLSHSAVSVQNPSLVELNETKCHGDSQVTQCFNAMSQINKSNGKKAELIVVTTTESVTPPMTPALTYTRVKLLSSKNSVTNSQKLLAESLYELSDIKKKKSLEQKLSPKGGRRATLILPEIARLKNRPLSSSSICSTSSSSSSGSEHHMSKLNTSYLASVESLADQSENELVDGHNTLSVFERTCLEIVDSERSYVEDLRQVISGYLEDWKERACLKLDEQKILFSNIQKIYEFNSILLQQLVGAGMDPMKIANCFTNLREGFDVYTTYCTSYPEAISLLTSLLQASHTNALLTSTQKILQHTLPLGSYLLKPVQRILKYHLLLDNLRKHCGIEEVVQAYEIMREVASNIDQVKKKLEQQSRVKELSGILDGWLGPELTVLGELRQEGHLMENNKPRMVFLFQTMLIITKPKEDNRLQFKSYIYRNNLMLREHLPGEPTSFNVIPYDEPRNQIKLTAKNRDQKRLWAQNIKGVILEQFDIPNRAKELVYKLGDEEDRTPDKNIWKWSLSSATPVYLERRNQYRRSEMRNRSKIKRKTITNSSSFDTFNIKHKTEKANLIRNSSVDDNMMPSLQRYFKEESMNSQKKELKKCGHEDNLYHCNLTETETNDEMLINILKERSKSVPRIPSQLTESDEELTRNSTKNEAESGNLHKFSTMRKNKVPSSTEIKMYNSKTIPKRIANLKKKAKKETSKFYMNLNEIEDTVLKITESSENLSIAVNCDSARAINELHLKPEDLINNEETSTSIEEKSQFLDEEVKNDVEIITELLKEHRELGKILKKPPKKKSFDNGRTLSSPESMLVDVLIDTPPPPPSNSPPPLDLESFFEKLEEEKTPPIKPESGSEHVYETLLRNVHVPYKFSPVLNRSKSQQYSSNSKELRMKPAPRPESDYVTLVYMDHIDFDKAPVVDKTISGVESLRNSDSNINYEHLNNTKQISNATKLHSTGSVSSITDFTGNDYYAQRLAMNLTERFMTPNHETVTGSENSLLPRVRKSVENISLNLGKANKLPERRVSDVSEMCRQVIIHKQGSKAVGERMAHLDYADPRTLFNCSVANSSVSLNPQRDSVFSLTSSNDSVSNQKTKLETIDDRACIQSSQFTYEDNVEACLENDFRDSAVYSDESECRPERDMPVKRPCSPPPPPPPRPVNFKGLAKTIYNSRKAAPPSIPLKPSIPPKKYGNRQLTKANIPMTTSSTSSESVAKSWVLQQIENFDK